MIVRPHVASPLRLSLYVPHPESRLCTALARGSAIVGLPLATGKIRIYYEGNVIGAQNLKRYRDRAVQAAGRMLHSYPPAIRRGRERTLIHVRSLRLERSTPRRTGSISQPGQPI